ncbi:MAG: MGMT family protein [Eubacteriales bacterium]
MRSESGFFASVYRVVTRIPRGKVASYGEVARAAGNPRMARQVGWALHHNPMPGKVPCHRVVMRDGSLTPSFAFGGEEVQRTLLTDEGVLFMPDGRVDKSCFTSLTDTDDA